MLRGLWRCSAGHNHAVFLPPYTIKVPHRVVSYEQVSRHNDIIHAVIKRSSMPNMGDPIESPIGFVVKRPTASKLLAQIEQVGSMDSQVPRLQLRMCGGVCKVVHVSRSTLPSDASHVFDADAHRCFTENTAINTPLEVAYDLANFLNTPLLCIRQRSNTFWNGPQVPRVIPDYKSYVMY